MTGIVFNDDNNFKSLLLFPQLLHEVVALVNGMKGWEVPADMGLTFN